MKYVFLFLLAVSLTGCGPEPRNPARAKDKVTVKTLQEIVVDDNASIRVLCIDGIKYLQTEQGGIAPKFQAWEDADATVEECE